ncbi:MAG: hypothetical protein JWP27_6 [Flaviaesturariibacter sp.]|nr:hypothetical protein [Flaviaesturariibacter sp.]
MAVLSLAGSSCANIVPPEGGPRDTVPPRLLKATPPDSAVNVRARTIELQFDEFVDLQDVQKNLLFTPTFAVNPRVEVKLRTVTVRLPDSLEANTTYTFNFGNAIKDINEGNVLRNFTYTFSTGPALDSLTLTGKVLMAETGRIDTTLTVLLYPSLSDSAVITGRPRYVARLNSAGEFTFRNLPAGTFAVYALGDPSNLRRYQSRTQQAFGFLDSAIVVRRGTAPLTILAYREAAPAAPITVNTGAVTGRDRPSTDKRLRVTTTLQNGTQDLLTDLQLRFEKPLRRFDSTGIRLSTDSTFTPAPFTVRLDSTRQKINLKTTWKEGTAYHLELDKGFADDSAGRALTKSDTIHFTTRKRSDYATVSIRLRGVDLKQRPVLLFYQNNALVFSAAVPTGTFTNAFFMPGDYELRVLYDRNGNGVWDPGQFPVNKRQPEVVKPIERRAAIKAGVENEFEVNL